MAVSPPADGFEDDGWEPVPCPSLRDAIAECIDPLTRQRLRHSFPRALQVSALDGEGLEGLKESIADRFSERFEPVRLLIPHSEGARLAELYALGAPIEERSDLEEGVLVVASLPRSERARYARYLVADAASAAYVP